jgi:hypothetical protein
MDKINVILEGSQSISSKTQGKKPEREISLAQCIRRYVVAKILIDNEASLNLIMRNTFIEMSLNLVELTPVHDTFHDVIPDQSSTPIGRIDLNVSYEQVTTSEGRC